MFRYQNWSKCILQNRYRSRVVTSKMKPLHRSVNNMRSVVSKTWKLLDCHITYHIIPVFFFFFFLLFRGTVAN